MRTRPTACSVLLLHGLLAGSVGSSPAAAQADAVLQAAPLVREARPVGRDRSLRGLAAVDARTVWVGGSGGTLLRTVDGGASWSDVAPPDCPTCDFRDVHAVDELRALAMVAGRPARVFRTEDGGRSWRVVVEEPRQEAFFDALSVVGRHGLLFGDPTDGGFDVRTCDDGGDHWQRVPAASLPAPLPGEAAFAASGTCVEVGADGVLRIATGGGSTRLLWSADGGASWTAQPLPLVHGAASQGAFGIAFTAAGKGVVVGGDYAAPAASVGTAAWTEDGGRTWQPVPDGVLGYRSAVVWAGPDRVVAAGPEAVDVSADGGRTWHRSPGPGLHALARGRDGSLWGCGAGGRVERLHLPAAPAPFRPLRLFGDHMVVPVAAPLPLRGIGPAGARVEALASWGARAEGDVDAEGRWRVDLAPPGRGDRGTIELRCGDQRHVLEDLLGGDVWLASGQSNMEMTVGDTGGWRQGVRDWRAEVAAADLPTLRYFTVERRTAGAPLEDVEGEWRVVSPATAGACSATAFFAARELIAAGKGPQGLVVAAWGGTVCEAWTSPAGLATFPEFAAGLRRAAAPAEPAALRAAAFWRAVPTSCEAPGAAVEVPDLWSASGLQDHDGVVFYERTVPLPAQHAGQPLSLALGPIDDRDTVWANGVRIGGQEGDGAWDRPRRYEIPAAATAGASELQLRVRVLDTGGEGRFGSAEHAPALEHRAAGGPATIVASLVGPWTRRVGPKLEDLPSVPRDDGDEPNRPAVLWHAMVAPLAPFPFAGVFWYQGESNRDRPSQYRSLFRAMIGDWRAHFGASMPFCFVQIAPFAYDDERGQTMQLRLAQANALALPHTGMVVTLDCGERDDIHPRDKQTVGRRLALLARRLAYGDDVVTDGPAVQRVWRDGEALHVRFDAAQGGLRARGPVSGFEVVRASGEVVPVAARCEGEHTVVLTGATGAREVRYACAAWPEASLFGATGLPVAPFALAIED